MSGAEVAVVGSGPNGLAAAVVLARAGVSVEVFEAAPEFGGGMRSKPLFDDEVVHDICSFGHAMAPASRFFREFDLEARGVRLLQPEAGYAHPLDRGAGIAYRSLDRTCERLGVDGHRWRKHVGPLVERSREIVDLLLGDQRHLEHAGTALRLPAEILKFGLAAARLFTGQEACGMIAGVAAHATGRLPSLPAGGVVAMLAPLAHSTGWTLPRGGSQRIADALVADLLAHNGKLHANAPIADLRDLKDHKVVLLNTAPRGLLDVAGDLLPSRYRRTLEKVRYGPAAAKVDFLVTDPIPWAEPEVRVAGTVHVGGTMDEIYASETAIARGKKAARPFVLVSDPMVVDPTRGLPGKRPVLGYCHVPNGDPADVTDTVRRQIERFAPGFSDTIIASRCTTAPQLEAYNPNYVGGDISSGAVSVKQMIARPALQADPYATPLGGVYLCSGGVTPGPGVHGMGGFHAAASILRREFGIRELPGLHP
ncbi:phytoene desaturase family protein [Amycolatopsis sp. NPDC059657]|uniref:phytoene desaturase family protein n=1 Tax=Amycolatopsis sp. NPDC059657 TaxID=3346899 RepID=UPI003671B90F